MIIQEVTQLLAPFPAWKQNTTVQIIVKKSVPTWLSSDGIAVKPVEVGKVGQDMILGWDTIGTCCVTSYSDNITIWIQNRKQWVRNRRVHSKV